MAARCLGFLRSGSLSEYQTMFHEAKGPFSWQDWRLITGPAFFLQAGGSRDGTARLKVAGLVLAKMGAHSRKVKRTCMFHPRRVFVTEM